MLIQRQLPKGRTAFSIIYDKKTFLFISVEKEVDSPQVLNSKNEALLCNERLRNDEINHPVLKDNFAMCLSSLSKMRSIILNAL